MESVLVFSCSNVYITCIPQYIEVWVRAEWKTHAVQLKQHCCHYITWNTVSIHCSPYNWLHINCLHPLFTLQLVAHKLSPSTMMHPTNRQSTVRGTMGGIDNTLHPTVVQLVECFIIVHVTSQGFYFTSGENCNEEPWNTISAVFVELCICYLCHWLY